MNNDKNIIFLKGSTRYKGANDVGINLQIPLNSTNKEVDEFDRTSIVNLAQLYDTERQKSTKFRPLCKVSLLFDNSYSGFTVGSGLYPNKPYPPFNNNLFYTNALESKLMQTSFYDVIPWGGIPQYNEFSFMRTDFGVSGYTYPPNEHVYLEKSKVSNYNWSFYYSYAFSSTTATTMQITTSSGGTFLWTCGDGIPYEITRAKFNGKSLIRFTCKMEHGLSVGDSVKLNTNCNGLSYFGVYSLGDGYSGSELYVFNVYDLGFSCPGLNSGNYGTFKKFIPNTSLQDGLSTYYVRIHKILTNSDKAVVTNAGFEKNGLRIVKKFESKQLTPNQVSRISVKEDSQSYNISNSDDIDINGLTDNLNRPISEIFLTVINKGYMGWFNKPYLNNTTALKQGWEFNLGPQLNDWWKKDQPLSDCKIPVSSYSKNYTFVIYTQSGQPAVNNLPQFALNSFNQSSSQTKQFYYNADLYSGQTIIGDFCEWNNIEQTERVISKYHHKFTYNSENFNIGGNPNNQLGFYYQPHHPFQIKVYSNYVEESNTNDSYNLPIAGLPEYSYYRNSTKQYIWRDLYDYGFFDNEGRGVDYPFLNGAHYPFSNFTFRIIPEGSNVNLMSNNPNEPLFDDCE